MAARAARVADSIAGTDQSGFAVSSLGDSNSDGWDDILIGTPYADPHGAASGQSFVVYGDGNLPSTPTPTQPPGNCNADDAVDTADVSALVLEIFDGDGMDPAAVPGGSFPGDPHGCNANADAAVDAGDLACTVRRILDPGAGCGP